MAITSLTQRGGKVLFVELGSSHELASKLIGLAKQFGAESFSYSFVPEATSADRTLMSCIVEGLPRLEMVVNFPTTYPGESPVQGSVVFPFSDQARSILNERLPTISKVCDSIVLYGKNGPEWIACLILHEHIALFRDPLVEHVLCEQKIPYSTTAPAWW